MVKALAHTFAFGAGFAVAVLVLGEAINLCLALASRKWADA